MGDSTDLATTDPTSRKAVSTETGGVPQPLSATSMMAMVRELALDDRVDAGKLETVMRVANQQQDREREIQFYQDKNRAVRQMPAIRKDGRIVIADKNAPNDRSRDRVQGHFEKWADVQQAVTPVLDANNMTLTHKIDHSDGQTIVIAVLTHDNGYREESGPMRLPLDTSGGKNNVQGAGSSQTYGMRYTTRAICGLKLIGGQGDDDGNLLALPDEPLNDQQQRRVKEAEAAWAAGPEIFEEWFGKIQPVDRAWFIQTGRYRDITGKDTGLLISHSTPAPEEKPKPTNGGGEAPATSTPEGWTAKYEADCDAAPDLDALARIQARGAKGLQKLKDSGETALHARAIKAGSDAYARLSGVDQASDELFPGDR